MAPEPTALVLSQATLVATQRVAVHRRLGWVGPALVAVIIVLGFFMSVEGALRDSDLSGDQRRLVTEPAAPPPTEAENVASVLQPLGVFLDFGLADLIQAAGAAVDADDRGYDDDRLTEKAMLVRRLLDAPLRMGLILGVLFGVINLLSRRGIDSAHEHGHIDPARRRRHGTD
jgi:hypothetical protein